MTKAYKYRIYPTDNQKVSLAKTFGSVRFYWNNLVASFNTYDKETNPKPTYKTQKELKEEYSWLSEVSAASLQQKHRDFDSLQKQYFNPKRKTQVGRPQFKKRSNNQSFRLPSGKFRFFDNKISIEKVGRVKVVFDRNVPEDAKLLSCTVSKNCAGQYFVSVCFETNMVSRKQKTNKGVGIDLGIKELATLSDGTVISNPKWFRENQSKLKRLQQHFSRKKKGSRRFIKNRERIARFHNDISNQRRTFLHQLTTSLVTDYDVICIEDLNVKGMMQNHKLAKSIGEIGFYELRRQLEYKCEWYGKTLAVIGRFEPSSKTCCCCGWKNNNLTLSDRVFYYEDCGLKIDRDLNAANNIYRLGVDSLETNAETEVTKSVKRLGNEVFL